MNNLLNITKRLIWKLSIRMFSGNEVIQLFRIHFNHEPSALELFKLSIKNYYSALNKEKLIIDLRAKIELAEKKHQVLWRKKIHELKETVKNYHFDNVANRAENAAVIVESREHKDLEVIVKNVMSCLETGWSLYIFHGTNNETYVKKTFSKAPQINFISLETPTINREQYSTLLKTPEFWKKIEAKKVLLFQTDSIMLKKGAESFLKYDYIGAPWNSKHFLSKTEVGNGGFSIRTKQTMIEISEKYKDDNLSEDVFYSKYCKINGYALPTKKIAGSFCLENTITHPSPIAVHHPILIPQRKLSKILFGQA
ncbi:DUF5672 family protein [Roseivirga pacifica]